MPESYSDFADWTSKYFPGRLKLHPRTRRSLNLAAYQDIPLVAKALQLLADEYWHMRMDGRQESKDEFWDGLAALGLRLDGSITPERAGEQQDQYFVQWPPDNPRRTFIDKHLRKGATKDDRVCLAIYFFWDESINQVVVCWLPSHLDNRMG